MNVSKFDIPRSKEAGGVAFVVGVHWLVFKRVQIEGFMDDVLVFRRVL